LTIALSLREAALRTGTKPSTIFRAILSGRLSFGRDDDGSYAFSAEELERVFSAERRVDPARIPLAQLRVISPQIDTADEPAVPPDFEPAAAGDVWEGDTSQP
jgi:hypothetical protein